MLRVKLHHALAVGHDAIGATCQVSIDGQFVPDFPTIDAPFAGDDARHAHLQRGLSAVTIGGEEPGLHEMGAELADEFAQPPVGGRVQFPAFVDRVQRNLGAVQFVAQWAPSS